VFAVETPGADSLIADRRSLIAAPVITKQQTLALRIAGTVLVRAASSVA